jgi:hypothetical protein
LFEPHLYSERQRRLVHYLSSNQIRAVIALRCGGGQGAVAWQGAG